MHNVHHTGAKSVATRNTRFNFSGRLDEFQTLGNRREKRERYGKYKRKLKVVLKIKDYVNKGDCDDGTANAL